MRVNVRLALGAGALGTLVTAGAAGWILSRAPPSEPEPARSTTAPRASPPPPPRPVPHRLASAHDAIRRLRQDGRFEEGCRAYVPFLEALAAEWGPGDPGLAPHHYNFALALKLAGDRRACISAAAAALERWPEHLQLLVLEATTRAEDALERGVYDRRADAVFQRLLDQSAYPRLQGVGVDPAALHALHAEMLLRSGRTAQALAGAEAGLAVHPAHRGCLSTKARSLAQLERPRDAAPLLERLLADAREPELELFLARARLDLGEFESAWTLLAPLLERTDLRDGRLLVPLRTDAARALCGIGRPRDAVRVLLPALAREGEARAVLHQLAVSARALGAIQTAAALDRRVRALAPREFLLEQSRSARIAGFTASAFYHEARAWLVTSDTGEALRLLDRALAVSPDLPEVHAEKTHVLRLLGRYDLAERQARAGLEKTGSPALAGELACVLALRGKPAEARRLLERAPPTLRALGLLELGDLAAAGLELRALEPRGEQAVLASAELAAREGRLAEARAFLAGSFHALPGGPAWARVLGRFADLLEGRDAAGPDRGPAPQDDALSDWLDHPRLIAHLLARLEALPDRAVETALELQEVHARRAALLKRVEGFSASEVVSRWHDIAAFYAEAGAARKAREASWYLASLRPRGIEEARRLAETLSRPEELALRIAVLARILQTVPHAELERLHKESIARLGLEAAE